MARLHRVEDYFAGVLEGRERGAFERHLESCPQCAKGLKELQDLDKKLATHLPRTLPYREPRREWLVSLGYELPMPRRGRYHRIWLLAAPAIAALLVIIVMFALNECKGASPDLRPAHIEDYQDGPPVP